MTGKLFRLGCSAVVCVACAIGSLPQWASALDTANVLMNIDGMVMNHGGLFRNFTPADGAQTFQYGVFQSAAGSQGRYKSFFLVIPGGASDTDGCCISHRIRIESWGPTTFQEEGTTGNPDVYGTVVGDFTDAYYPVIDRAGFGTLIDPSEYQIEVKFKPLIGMAGVPNNVAKEFNASIDRHYGYSFNAEKGIYERALEQINYSIGVNSDADYNSDGFVNTADRDIVEARKGQTFTLPNENPFAQTPGVVDYEDLVYWENREGRVVTPINDWYATAPKDANGFATWKVALNDNVDSGRTTNINYGDAVFRDDNTVAGGGRVQNPDNFTTPNAWEDVQTGFGGPMFGGGPDDPSRPDSKLKTPNGINLLYFGKNGRHPDTISLEVLSVAVTKINPGSIAARIDENSGLSARFGSGFTRGPDFAPINVPGDGQPYLPLATDQISRFDENGMTNLIFNMRTPDAPGPNGPETHRFLLRYGPGANTFDGSTATVNVRARLTQALGGGIAETLTLVAKDLDGNDLAANQGADEYTYNLALNQFNTSTFTTVSIPLSAFSLSTHVPRDDVTPTFGSGPGGFVNAGDGSRTVFNLYEFGGLLAPNTGLLKLELDYMEIRLPELGLAGDFNGNHVVDAADYTVWRNNLGATEGSLLGGNGNGGVIDQTDYALWKLNFGMSNGAGGGAVAAVPEPGSCVLAALALVGCGMVRRQRLG